MDFRPEWELVFDDDDEGICELCEREMPLTFHHLFPKATHERIATHGLPADADDPKVAQSPGGIKGSIKDFTELRLSALSTVPFQRAPSRRQPNACREIIVNRFHHCKDERLFPL